MATPADMPKRIPTSPGGPRTRLRLMLLLGNVLDEVERDGALPNGQPHPAMEFLPELVSAVAAYSSMTFAVFQASYGRTTTEAGEDA